MKRFVIMIALALIGTSAEWGLAQNYPTRTIRLVVPTAPGGTSDILGRMLAQKLGEALGQQVIADNRPGASNTIGIGLAIKSPADGYTLAITPSSLAINPSIFKKMPYDTLRDLTPVSQLAAGPLMLSVHPSVPARSVKELVALAKSKPEHLMLASAGVGTIPHLAAELFNLLAGVKMTQVIYKGTGAGLHSVLSGEVAVVYASPISVMAYVNAGRLRPIGITTKTRSPALPHVPAIAETLPGYDAATWFGVVAPAGTPRPIIDRLSQEISRVMRAPDMKERLAASGIAVLGSTPEEFASTLRLEMEKWAKVVKAAGIQAQ